MMYSIEISVVDACSVGGVQYGRNGVSVPAGLGVHFGIRCCEWQNRRGMRIQNRSFVSPSDLPVPASAGPVGCGPNGRQGSPPVWKTVSGPAGSPDHVL